MHDVLAKVSQVLASTVKGSLVRCMTTAKDLSVHFEEIALVEGNLILGLCQVAVLVDHQILQHAILVKDLFVDLLIEESHGVVRIFAGLISHCSLTLFLKKDV